MTDSFDPNRGSQAGMDPEGLMPADPALHELDEDTPVGPGGSEGSASTELASGGAGGPLGDTGNPAADTAQAVADAFLSPHDQPVEGGVEQAEDGGAGR